MPVPLLAFRSDRRRALLAMASAPVLSGSWLAGSAQAQDVFPNKPVKIICPYSSGSPVDIAGRYMADRLQSAGLGQPAVVENLGGAGGTTGTSAMLRAPADGHVLLTQFTSALVTTQFLYSSAKYDVLKDFVPIWSLASSGTVFVVSANSPYKTLQELLAAARAQPGRVSYGSAGVGTPPHLNAEMFMRKTGIKMTHVPYRGSGQVIADILGGHLDCQFSAISAAAPFIADGRLRGLAVLREDRVPELPQVPTLVEGGITGWVPPRSTFGLFAPAGTPASVVNKLMTTLTRAYEADTEGRARLGKMGLSGVVAGPDLTALMQREYELYKTLLADLRIQPLG